MNSGNFPNFSYFVRKKSRTFTFKDSWLPPSMSTNDPYLSPISCEFRPWWQHKLSAQLTLDISTSSPLIKAEGDWLSNEDVAGFRISLIRSFKANDFFQEKRKGVRPKDCGVSRCVPGQYPFCSVFLPTYSFILNSPVRDTKWISWD